MWDTTTNSTSFLSFPNSSPSPQTFLLPSIHFLYSGQGLPPEFMPFMYFKRPFVFLLAAVHVLVPQLCPTLCDSMDSTRLLVDSLWLHGLYQTSGRLLPGFFVDGILQARILEWVAISFSRGSSRSRYRIWVSCIASRFFTIWAT